MGEGQDGGDVENYFTPSGGERKGEGEIWVKKEFTEGELLRIGSQSFWE